MCKVICADIHTLVLGMLVSTSIPEEACGDKTNIEYSVYTIIQNLLGHMGICSGFEPFMLSRLELLILEDLEEV